MKKNLKTAGIAALRRARSHHAFARRLCGGARHRSALLRQRAAGPDGNGRRYHQRKNPTPATAA